ncbi:MAG: 2,5-dihydroxypyridine 5,6-dioxygenase [Candidatus Binatota bacterium]|nr:2,5-dihydroxypyridine 5,6-dioxygenase [Candidatus Binatota bacterium]
MALSIRMTEMVGVFKKELELCGVREGETVAILSELDQLADYAAAFMTAARSLGAHTFNVNVLPATGMGIEEKAGHVGVTSIAGNRPAIDALKQADLVIDLVFLLFSPEQIEIQKAGTRILLCVEPFEVLTRLFPTRQLRERVEAGEEWLKKAETLRFTNAAGTDVRYTLGQYGVFTEYGYTDTPGRWDHWPGGFLATCANEGGVQGKVVMDRGDIIYPFKSYVHDPIEFTIRDGMIVDIQGGVDAKILGDYMASYRDPKAYGVSHIGWGLNEAAQWSAHATGVPGIGMDGRAYYGNVLFSTGPNFEFGGPNDTHCHLDLPMKGCTLTLDDEPIVENGEIVPKEMRAPGR